MTEASTPLSARQEPFFHAVVQASPVAVVVVDSKTRIAEVNSRAETLFGYEREALLGEPLERLVPTRYRPAHPAFVQHYFSEPETRAMGAGRELFALCADGSEVQVEIGLSPFRTEEGLFTLASIIDISERRRAEADQARLAALVQSSSDAIISKDREGVITSWNVGAERLFGFAKEEAVGQTMQIVIPQDRLKEEAEILSRIRQGEHIEHFETIRKTKQGSEIDVSVTVSPVLLASGEIAGASSIIRNISEARKREEELRRSNAELEQFAYIASHDLQEPLRTVANYVELLASRYAEQLDERAHTYIHYASDGARRMQQLVSDLLAYSRVGSQGKPMRPTQMQDVAERVVRNLATRMENSDARVEFADLPCVIGDELQLEQLLQNLVGNALKFRSDAAPWVRIDAQKEGRLWHLSVSDNGIGMDLRHAERIFQMFQRLHKRGDYEGSGIGLAIAKRIVERHGGQIWVESKPGEGTTMHFTLRDAR